MFKKFLFLKFKCVYNASGRDKIVIGKMLLNIVCGLVENEQSVMTSWPNKKVTPPWVVLFVWPRLMSVQRY